MIFFFFFFFFFFFDFLCFFVVIITVQICKFNITVSTRILLLYYYILIECYVGGAFTFVENISYTYIDMKHETRNARLYHVGS